MWGFLGFREITPTLDNRLDEKLEHEMGTYMILLVYRG